MKQTLLMTGLLALLTACGQQTASTTQAGTTPAAQVPTKSPLTAQALTLAVTNINDSGAGSLRQAILDANAAPGADSITFQNGLTGTLTLTTGELVIADDVTITGPGASVLTISGNNASRVFFVNPGAPGAMTGPPATSLTVRITDLTIADGRAKGGNGASVACGGGGGGAAGMGGGLFVNHGALTLSGVAFTNGQAVGGSGGGGGERGYCVGTGGGGVGGDGSGTSGGSGGNLGGGSAAGGTIFQDPPASGGEGAGGGGAVFGSGNSGNGGFGGGGAGSIRGDGGDGGFGGGGGGGENGYRGVFGGNGGGFYGSSGGGGAGLGGAVFVRAGSLALQATRFTGNSASGGNGAENGQGKAGAVFVMEGVTTTGCAIFSGNSATSAAGSDTDTGDVYGASIASCTDSTAPVITPTVTGTKGTNDWYTGTVNVKWTVTDEDSPVTSTQGCDEQNVTADTNGVTFTCTATSAGGTSTRSVTVKRDATAPTLDPKVSPNPVVLGGTATATPNASETLSGLASASCGTVTTSSVGSQSVSCTATDQAGNTATMAATYTVAYPFRGFLQPVDNLPTVNTVKAGSSVPVKFSLGGNRGLNVLAAGSPRVSVVACDGSAPADEIEQTLTVSTSSLKYDAASDTYSYTWKTDKSWAGSCRQLNVALTDGTSHLATFRFR